jgi:hypothetical protein
MKKIITFLFAITIGSLNFLSALTSQTITFDAISNQISRAGTFTITATAQSGLPVTFTVSTGAPSIVSATVVTYTVIAGKSYAEVTLSGSAVGPVTIKASQAGNGSFSAATPVNKTFSVVNNVFTFPVIANQTFVVGSPAPTIAPTYTATANFGLAIFSSSNAAVATVDPSTGVITCTGGGTVTITGTVPAQPNANGATAFRTFIVAKATNTFTFPAIANQVFTIGVPGPVITPSYTATANFGSATYSTSNAAIATVNGFGVITCISSGVVTISAKIAATPTETAASAARTFTITKAANTITLGALANTFVSGTPPAVTYTVLATPGTANTPAAAIVFSSSNNSVATINSSTGVITYPGINTGVVTITASCAATAKVGACATTETFTVTPKAANTFTFPIIPNQTFVLGVAGPVIAPTYTATSNFNTATYTSSNTAVAVVDVNTGEITCTGSGSVKITASIAATASELGATAYRIFTVSKATNTISMSPLINTIVGTPSPVVSYTVAATPGTLNTPASAVVFSSSNSAVAIVNSSTGVITFPGTTVGIVKITVSCAATAKVASCTTSSTFTVTAKKTNNFTFPAIANQTFTLGNAGPVLTPFYTATFNFGTATYTSSNIAVATVNPSTGVITCVGAGTVAISGVIAETATELGAKATRSFIVSKATNTISLSPIVGTYVLATPPVVSYTVAATPGTSNTPAAAVVFTSSNPTIAAINSSTGVITYPGSIAGVVTITASCAATAKVAACATTATFTVTPKITNTFTFPAVANQTFVLGATDPVITPTYTATVNFGSAVFTSSNATVATVNPSSGVITCVGAGSVTITGTIASTSSAMGVIASRTFTVSKAKNLITLGALSGIITPGVPPVLTYTVAATPGTFNTSASAVVFTSSNPTVASIDPSTGVITYPGTVLGSVTITASCAASNKVLAYTTSKTFIVSRVSQSIVFDTIGTRYPTELVSAHAVANFALPLVYSVVSGPATIDASTGVITLTGALGTVSVRAYQAGTPYVYPAISTISFSVVALGTPKSFKITLEEEQSFDLTVFPNPSNGLFTVSQSDLMDEVTVFDLLGNIVTKKSNLNGVLSVPIELSEIASGIYLVQSKSKTGSSIRRIVIE